MHHKTILSVLSIFCIFSSCSTEESADVNQDRIQMTLRLEYDANRDQTEATAVFRFGEGLGTLLELTPPSAIRFDEQEMFYSQDLLTSEYKVSSTSKISQGIFEYIDLDGHIFINNASLPTPITFTAPLTNLSKSQSNRISVSGIPLLSNEKLQIILEYTSSSEVGISYFEFHPGEAVIISSEELSDVPAGSAKITLEKSRERNLEQGTSAGGSMSEKYLISQNVLITD